MAEYVRHLILYIITKKKSIKTSIDWMFSSSKICYAFRSNLTSHGENANLSLVVFLKGMKIGIECQKVAPVFFAVQGSETSPCRCVVLYTVKKKIYQCC